MQLRDAVIVVTGGASGIGRAMCRRFVREQARTIVVVDRNDAAHDVARDIGGRAQIADVATAEEIQRVVQETVREWGRIDLFCSNAGIGGGSGGLDTATADWQRIWDVNVMAHVHAARAVVPLMIAQGGGYLLHTASAAGLLTQIGSAPYAVTKHAAVAFAEWLAITYGEQGIRVSCLCPQGVRTPMLEHASAAARSLLDDSALHPDDVAEAVVKGIGDEKFLILPHPEVATYVRRKADDHDRWIRGMRRLQERIEVR
jgi:NAD(P)-dependent dehydrogenase (short-subunit alcohol dehydrogenase family)